MDTKQKKNNWKRETDKMEKEREKQIKISVKDEKWRKEK